ncbi:hypothetical protein NOK93_24780 [Vibrio parahaemolyticus]|uniref:DUF5677 domain-containing protein n=1 Tax=Vibrio parahaemolyticus TaxID=670 RepID=UPI00226AE428|nr:DUF5677 domain-containing protein [Vibrio parahaemolyticus]MCX8778940.1 hypothetical protein [Vibrio parahaemolyticus]
MMDIEEKSKEKVEFLASEIKGLQLIITDEIGRLESLKIENNFNKFKPSSWCLSATRDALIKLRIFTENNFDYIETMNVISVSRYILELSIWMKLFERDHDYGMVYYSQLISTQKKYWNDLLSQARREISLLKSFEEEEGAIRKEKMQEIFSMPENEALKHAKNWQKDVMDTIDSKAARFFSIYADDAKVNGYGYQAYLVETKLIPEIEISLKSIVAEEAEFNKTVPDSIKNKIPKRWNWRDMAKKVDMDDEYDYIYSFSSKLIHATPVSVTTNNQSLEIQEICIFLKYILVKIQDVIDCSIKYSPNT